MDELTRRERLRLKGILLGYMDDVSKTQSAIKQSNRYREETKREEVSILGKEIEFVGGIVDKLFKDRLLHLKE